MLDEPVPFEVLLLRSINRLIGANAQVDVEGQVALATFIHYGATELDGIKDPIELRHSMASASENLDLALDAVISASEGREVALTRADLIGIFRHICPLRPFC